MLNFTIFNRAAIFFCLFLMAISSVAQEIGTTRRIYIDPLKVPVLTATQVLDQVSYIPLETTSESRFNTINKLSVIDQYYIIQETNTNRIFLFTREGKFHCRIDLKPYSGAFAVNNTKNEIVVNRGRTNTYYNFDGEKLREEPETTIGSPYFFANGSIGYVDYRVSERYLTDTISHEYRVIDKGKEKGRFLPYNMKYAVIQSGDNIHTWHTHVYETGSDTSAFYCRRFEYNIYRLSTTGISMAYSLVFPQNNTMSDSVFTIDSLKGHRYAYFKNHHKRIYGLSFVYQTGNNLFFRLDSWLGNLNGNDSYIFNLKTNTLLSVKHITSDALNYNLPLTDIFNGGNFFNWNFLTSDGKYVYTSLKSDLMFKANAVNNESRYPKTLKAYFATGKSGDNPVIVQIGFKENVNLTKAVYSNNLEVGR
jgi:hypothetical protein